MKSCFTKTYWFFIFVIGFVGVLFSRSVQATTYFVDPTGNNLGACTSAGAGACQTIQGAIDKGSTNNTADTINVAAGTYTGPTIFNTTTPPKNYTVVGAGFAATIFDGQNSNNIKVQSQVTVDLSGITIQNGNAGGSGQGGGGIKNEGTLLLHECVVKNSHADDGEGGGIGNVGSLVIVNCTISGNVSVRNGGGIANGGEKIGGSTSNAGSLIMVNSTISGNSVSLGGGGGIYNESCTAPCTPAAPSTASLFNVTIANNTGGAAPSGASQIDGGGGILVVSGTFIANNSLIANNTDSSTKGFPDCSGTLNSTFGHNLILSVTGCTLTGSTTGNKTGQAPNLDTLKDNGGNHLPTLALLSGSPAIDAGSAPADGGCKDQTGMALSTDERAQPQSRPVAGIQGGSAICDMGAFEAAAGTTPSGGNGGGKSGCSFLPLQAVSNAPFGTGLLIMGGLGLLGWVRRKS